MTSPLDSFNSHGIRVVANRGPVNEAVRDAFMRHSRGVAERIREFVEGDRGSRGPSVAAKHAK
jgi:hypothetical protein